MTLSQEDIRSRRAPPIGPVCGQACDVFICHRGPVKHNLVETIKERLERANLTVFVDYKMRKGLFSWPHVLATLRGARRMLILLTPDFEESPWCLEEARAAVVRQDAVLPVFIDRKASWDDEKLLAAFNEFAADRDFQQLRSEERALASGLLEIWRKALDAVACVSYMMHSSTARCDDHVSAVCWCIILSRCLIHVLQFALQMHDKSDVLPTALKSSCARFKHTFWRPFARCCAQRLYMK